MKKNGILLAILLSASSLASAQEDTVVGGLDMGPLAKLVGSWVSTDAGGVDVAPAQAGTKAGKGASVAEPYYEVITIEPAADATNASQQYLTAVYYKQEVFRKRDDAKFHDQRGYFIYDKENQMIYNSFCVPRAVCVVAEGKVGDVITLKAPSRGIAESEFMTKNGTTTDFTMTLDISKKDLLTYSQTTSLHIYDKPFSHTDGATLKKVK